MFGLGMPSATYSIRTSHGLVHIQVRDLQTCLCIYVYMLTYAHIYKKVFLSSYLYAAINFNILNYFQLIFINLGRVIEEEGYNRQIIVPNLLSKTSYVFKISAYNMIGDGIVSYGSNIIQTLQKTLFSDMKHFLYGRGHPLNNPLPHPLNPVTLTPESSIYSLVMLDDKNQMLSVKKKIDIKNEKIDYIHGWVSHFSPVSYTVIGECVWARPENVAGGEEGVLNSEDIRGRIAIVRRGISIYIYMFMCMYVHVYVCMCVYACIFIQIYISTNINIYVNIFMNTNMSRRCPHSLEGPSCAASWGCGYDCCRQHQLHRVRSFDDDDDDVYFDKLQTRDVQKIYPLHVKRRLQPIRRK
jgi:hypothetical protein